MTSRLSRTAAPARHPNAGSSQLLPVRRLLRLMHAVVLRPLRAAAQRRELGRLSDRQLRDGGIDPALAGRGKAAVVARSTLLRLLSLR
jgi:uncharacterized protein YjiS (DUF1127 family)